MLTCTPIRAASSYISVTTTVAAAALPIKFQDRPVYLSLVNWNASTNAVVEVILHTARRAH